MIGQRTINSFAQFMELQERTFSDVLLEKYGVQHALPSHGDLLRDLVNVLRDIDAHTFMQVLSEVVATQGDLRSRVSPKYRFDERMHDLKKCLLLDGYDIQEKKLIQIDPEITDAAPFEDDLDAELRRSKLPRAQEIINKINDSAKTFRAMSPDYNASLTNARVALETVAADVAYLVAASKRLPPHPTILQSGDRCCSSF